MTPTHIDGHSLLTVASSYRKEAGLAAQTGSDFAANLQQFIIYEKYLKNVLDIVYRLVYIDIMKKDNSRETILECALKLFSAKGYDEVSIGEIVELAGVTKPTLYYFFGNKEGLFRELLKRNFEALNQLLAVACRYDPNPDGASSDVYSVLLEIVKTYFAFAAAHDEFYLICLDITFAAPQSIPAKISKEYFKTQYLLVEKAFRDISETHPELKDQERVCSWRLLSMINSKLGFWSRGYGTLEESDAQSMVALFTHGMLS